MNHMLSWGRGSLRLVLVASAALALAASTACSDDETDGGTGGSTANGTGGSGGDGTGGGGTGGTGGGGTGGAGGSGGGDACAPGDVSDFEADWTPSIGLYQSECTVSEIQDIINDCLGPDATEDTCEAVMSNNADCGACVLSTDPTGPLMAVSAGDYAVVDGNTGHCLSALEDDDSAQSCGAQYDAARQCALASCSPSCFPINDDPAFLAFVGCIDDALEGPCKSYADDADECASDLIDDDPIYGTCFWDDQNESFKDFAERLIRLHCGPPPV